MWKNLAKYFTSFFFFAAKHEMVKDGSGQLQQNSQTKIEWSKRISQSNFNFMLQFKIYGLRCCQIGVDLFDIWVTDVHFRSGLSNSGLL